jgi:hypothetical protein
MADSRDDKGKPAARWPIDSAAPPAREDAAPRPEGLGEAQHNAGHIVHDERGNAVWNWVKETGRICIDSTSALLRKLDFGDLKVEGEKDEGFRLEDQGRDEGGGYDPYNQKTPPQKPKSPAGK